MKTRRIKEDDLPEPAAAAMNETHCCQAASIHTLHCVVDMSSPIISDKTTVDGGKIPAKDLDDQDQDMAREHRPNQPRLRVSMRQQSLQLLKVNHRATLRNRCDARASDDESMQHVATIRDDASNGQKDLKMTPTVGVKGGRRMHFHCQASPLAPMASLSVGVVLGCKIVAALKRN